MGQEFDRPCVRLKGLLEVAIEKIVKEGIYFGGRTTSTGKRETKRERGVGGRGSRKQVQGGRGELEQETMSEGAKRWGE